MNNTKYDKIANLVNIAATADAFLENGDLEGARNYIHDWIGRLGFTEGFDELFATAVKETKYIADLHKREGYKFVK